MNPSTENRYPRRQLNKKTKQRLMAQSQGKCSMCGASGVAMDISHILPLSLGGTNSQDNLILLCPNCNSALNMRPHGVEFILYLSRLLSSTPEYSSIAVEPLLGGDLQLRPDLIATRGMGVKSKKVLIECKNSSALSAEQLDMTIRQLRKYAEVANPDELVLSFPGRIHPVDLNRLRSASIEVWDLDYIAHTFAVAIAANPHPYFQPLFQAVAARASVAEEPSLIEKLRACSPGIAEWPVYQKLVGQILEHLFCPPLETPLSQSADEAEVNRRDYVVANSAEEGFWRFMREKYSADYIVVDAKNSGKPVTKDDALQIANYLKPHGAGLFGIVVCRKGPDEGCMHTLRDQWSQHKKMVLVINDEELESMLLARSAGERAEAILSTKLQEFRLSM